MTRLVIDTNIAFSAMLNVNSRIGQILLSGSNYYEYFSPEYLRQEILEHKEKIKSFGRLTERAFIEVYNLVLHNVTILNHSLIPGEIYSMAEKLCKNIDEDDTAFVAIGEFTNARLWTGDRQLIAGLLKIGYNKIITTEELYLDFIGREKKTRKS